MPSVEVPRTDEIDLDILGTSWPAIPGCDGNGLAAPLTADHVHEPECRRPNARDGVDALAKPLEQFRRSRRRVASQARRQGNQCDVRRVVPERLMAQIDNRSNHETG